MFPSKDFFRELWDTERAGRAGEIVDFMGRRGEVQSEKGLPIANFLLPIGRRGDCCHRWGPMDTDKRVAH
jgi:hypothetical protein